MYLSKKNKIKRLIWNIVSKIFFRPFVSKFFNPWRMFLLKVFGAKIHKTAGAYATCNIWAPWNLELARNAWLGPYVKCYNVSRVIIEENATVSQYSYLCTASHDITDPKHELIAAPIVISKNAWVGADAFIGMGVAVGEGAVVGARAAVFKDVEPWTVVGGNPAKYLKKRKYKDD